MNPLANIATILMLTASVVACGTSGKGDIRSKEAVHCSAGEQKVCRGGTATRLETNEPDATEFCTCQPRTAPIDHL